MHARELVEVAGLVALHGPLLAHGSALLPAHHLHQYWSTSKSRFENWSRALKSYAVLTVDDSANEMDAWVDVRATLDEIFVSELLTRVWSAVLVARDRQAGASGAEPVARSVMASHLEARHRALALLLHGRGISPSQAVSVNRLRRRAERWTDVLVGGLLQCCDVREFAHDPERAEEFAADLADRQVHADSRQAWRLLLISLAGAFHGGLSPTPANPDMNARITASILGCFGPELFDSAGLFHSLWMVRLAATASDAQGLITDLLGRPEGESAPRRQQPRRRI